MDWERKCIRLCAGMLVLSSLLRMTASGFFVPVGRLLRSSEAVSFFLWLQTGRLVRTAPVLSEPEQEPAVPPDGPERPAFSPEEAASVEITHNCSCRPDTGTLLARPLDWSLTDTDGPAVLILHTHGTEAYTPSEDEPYDSSGAYRTLDEEHNMLCLGQLVARRLEEAGIEVLHDRNLHDYPDYNSSYANAAASTEALLEQYPSIRLVLDLHRDAADTAYGQLVTQCAIGSEQAAQLMIVVGTDSGGQHHPDWEENLSLGLKLQVILERENPGICRPMNLTSHRYNQHLGHRALLIEIGAAGNTLREAELAAEALARGIIALKDGTQSK